MSILSYSCANCVHTVKMYSSLNRGRARNPDFESLTWIGIESPLENHSDSTMSLHPPVIGR